MKNYEEKALLYAEKYGIVDYLVLENEMVYYETFTMENATYKATVNLDTMKEVREIV